MPPTLRVRKGEEEEDSGWEGGGRSEREIAALDDVSEVWEC